MKLKKGQFLPAITTLSAKFGALGNTWQDKIKEIDEFGLKKMALFPTCLEKIQRQEMYKLLEKTKLKEIPFVHLRSDMPREELDYLIKRFKTKIFNIHTEKQWPLQFDLTKYKEMIFMENAGYSLDEQEIKQFAGVCVDFSHLENDRLLYPQRFNQQNEAIKSHRIGCNHIAAISKEPLFEREDGSAYNHKKSHFDKHTFDDLREFDYLKNYPKEYFSDFCAIEVENSLKEQLTVINYIIKIPNS